ncbi:MAG TPA: pyrimidine reductase family protein [Mycobacteriales bacterium]|nr:pyrimidine reductase family protein [Mycobacteriales bacterium]
MATPDGIALLPDTQPELDRYYGDAPHGVRANMVMTLDGAGAFDGRTKAVTDPADQALLLAMRGHADAIMVGAATVQAERYGPVTLSDEVRGDRVASGYAAAPPLVVVTGRSMLSPRLRIFAPEGPRTIIATLERSAEQAAALRDVADVVFVGDETIDLARLLAELGGRGLDRILCEGGPFLLSQLVEADLVDDMCLTVSPYLAGSQPTTDQPASAREKPTHLRLRHVLTRDDLLYLRYSRPVSSSA